MGTYRSFRVFSHILSSMGRACCNNPFRPASLFPLSRIQHVFQPLQELITQWMAVQEQWVRLAPAFVPEDLEDGAPANDRIRFTGISGCVLLSKKCRMLFRLLVYAFLYPCTFCLHTSDDARTDCGRKMFKNNIARPKCTSNTRVLALSGRCEHTTRRYMAKLLLLSSGR